MAISNITTNSNVYPSNTAADNKSNSSVKQTNKSNTEKITVTISEQARTLSKEKSKSGISDNNLPVEAYALPNWYADLHSDYTRLETDLGVPYSETNQARYDSLSNSEQENLKEYYGYLTDCLQESLQDRNINDPTDYYSFLKDDKMNKEVQLEVQQKLESNSRAIELMEYFDINK